MQEKKTYEITAEVLEDWTLDLLWSGGPGHVGEWQVLLVHDDEQKYRVAEVHRGVWSVPFKDANLDAAVEHYLVAVRKLTMEALGVAYKPMAPLPEDE